jgi:hypothetical protein
MLALVKRGKNKIINGDFGINQRAFSSSTAGNTNAYNFDRWMQLGTGGTTTWTAQTFTTGTAPVAGYEGKNFLQIASTGQSAVGDNSRITQKIESVRTFAGQTVTVSFWAKASTGTPNFAAYFYQDYGTGGSPSTPLLVNGNKVTLSTSWARYSLTIAIPSLSGKTLGTAGNDALWLIMASSAGSNFNAETNSLGIQTTTVQIWGVQVEAGSKATPFQTASGGSPQAELAMCQRYYQKSFAQGTAPATNAGRNSSVENYAIQAAGAFGLALVRLPVVMRTAPTVTIYNPSAANNQARNFTLSSDCSGTTVEGQTDTAFRYFYTLPASTVSTNVIIAHYEATAEL